MSNVYKLKMGRFGFSTFASDLHIFQKVVTIVPNSSFAQKLLANIGAWSYRLNLCHICSVTGNSSMRTRAEQSIITQQSYKRAVCVKLLIIDVSTLHAHGCNCGDNCYAFIGDDRQSLYLQRQRQAFVQLDACIAYSLYHRISIKQSQVK